MYVNLNKIKIQRMYCKKLSKRIRNRSQSYQSVKSKSKECMDLNRKPNMAGTDKLKKESNVYIIIITVNTFKGPTFGLFTLSVLHWSNGLQI